MRPITTLAALLLLASSATGIQQSSGDWKLIFDGAVTRILLFNVKADLGERRDTAIRVVAG